MRLAKISLHCILKHYLEISKAKIKTLAGKTWKGIIKHPRFLFPRLRKKPRLPEWKHFWFKFYSMLSQIWWQTLLKSSWASSGLINNKSNIQMVYILPGPNTMSLKQSRASQVSLISVSATASELLKVI